MTLINRAIHYLKQLDQTISCIPHHLYSQHSKLIPQSTIGKHTRHILDHYYKLKDYADQLQKDSPCQQPVICYDQRVRDTEEENDIKAAQYKINNLCETIAQWSYFEQLSTLSGGSKHLQIRVCTSDDGDTEYLQSTFDRELWFCIHHQIHHHAMIKIIAEELQCHVEQNEFGIAPSTLAHHKVEKVKQMSDMQ
ncbi:hypothetical protein MIR68_006844 [Amoeboaphelidium protococcarum]|nr:hypothetical protein MIR68_006844 [Amoeboaphelidium protococcarum]